VPAIAIGVDGAQRKAGTRRESGEAEIDRAWRCLLRRNERPIFDAPAPLRDRIVTPGRET
jgi:hypothetical protein